MGSFHGAVLDLANLQRADLAAANLQGADLLGANLQGANLQSAKLQGAELSGADLQGANLKSANLQGARLLSTNLQGARLGRANLQGSLLIDANLQGAGLDEVNLEGANLAGANLVAADLRGARLWWATVPSEAAQWSYADLRGTTVDRPLAEEIEAWKRAAQEITDESARDRVLEVLRRFEQILDLDGTPAFPVNWRTKADVLFDLDAHYAQGWADPLPIEAFDRSLAGHLIGLACTEETPPALAEGIAGRVYFEQKDERLYRAAVARSLVNGPCPPAEGLPRFMVARLKDLIRGAPAEAAPEGDAPVAGGPPAPAVAVEGEAPAGAPCSRAGESGRKE
jgi:hypothetical protein